MTLGEVGFGLESRLDCWDVWFSGFVWKSMTETKKMSTILRVGPYRFFFYSNEGTEPAHIHVQRDNALAKYWLDPVDLANATRFTSKETHEIQKIVEQHRDLFREAYHEYFAD